MEYYSSDQLYQYFEAEIKAASEKRLEALRAEIESLRENELAKVDRELKEAAEHEMNLSLRELKADQQIQMNRLTQDNAKRLMNKRLELLNLVFEEVKDQVLAFVKSAPYKEELKRKIASLSDVFGEDEVVFSIAKGDKMAKTAIEESHLGKSKVEETESIAMGGFFARVIEKGVEIDETIDFRLEDKRRWFYEKSNLYIKK